MGKAKASTAPTIPAAADYDPLATDDAGSYRPDRFYTSAGEKGADTATISVRIPLWMYAQLVDARNTVPAYDSQSDVIRDALRHRLHWIREEYDLASDPHAPYTDTLHMVETMNTMMQARIRIGKTMNEAVDAAIEVGDLDLATELIGELEVRAESMAGTVRVAIYQTCANARRRIREARERR